MCILMLSACGGKISTSDLKKAIKARTDGHTSMLMPVGRFTFVENTPKAYSYAGLLTIRLADLKELEKLEIIQVEVLKQKDNSYTVEVLPGAKIEECFTGNTRSGGGMDFASMWVYTQKFGKITKTEYDEDNGRGRCYYTTYFDEVSPIGRIMKGYKPGELVSEDAYLNLRKNQDGKWIIEQ